MTSSPFLALRFVFLVIAMLGATAIPASAAPGSASCGGDRYTTVFRFDSTAFATRNACMDYVTFGGSLIQPRVEITDEFGHAVEACEGVIMLRDFPANIAGTMGYELPDGSIPGSVSVTFSTDSARNVFVSETNSAGFGFGVPLHAKTEFYATFTMDETTITVSQPFMCK